MRAWCSELFGAFGVFGARFGGVLRCSEVFGTCVVPSCSECSEVFGAVLTRLPARARATRAYGTELSLVLSRTLASLILAARRAERHASKPTKREQNGDTNGESRSRHEQNPKTRAHLGDGARVARTRRQASRLCAGSVASRRARAARVRGLKDTWRPD